MDNQEAGEQGIANVARSGVNQASANQVSANQGRAKQQRSLKTYQQVLDSALQLFSSQGYFNTSISDISAHSGVSVGSIYHHFMDKGGIARALYESLVGRMADEISEICQQYRSAHDRCYAVIERLFQLTEESPAMMEFIVYAKHREFLPDEPPVCSSEPFALMRNIVRQGMESREIQSMDLMVASSCVFGGALRLITSHLDGLLETPLSDSLASVWQCSWRAVASEPA